MLPGSILEFDAFSPVSRSVLCKENEKVEMVEKLSGEMDWVDVCGGVTIINEWFFPDYNLKNDTQPQKNKK